MRSIAALLLAGSLLPSLLPAQTELATLRVKDGSRFGAFGQTAAVSGNVVLAGAPDDAIRGANFTGSVHVFRKTASGWVREARLIASRGALHDRFGFSLAIEGNVAVVGAPAHLSRTNKTGTVYIFRFDGKRWREEARFSRGRWFGSAVAISGSRVVAGGPGTRLPGLNWGGNNYAGAAWVFRHTATGWIQEAMLKAADAYNNDHFGSSVAIDGGTILVGAAGEGDDGQNRFGIGAVYRFEWSGSAWVQRQKIRASNFADQSFFGASLAMQGGVAVVGSPGKKVNGIWAAGTAYVLRRGASAWTEEAKLRSSWPATNTTFGGRVALSGNLVLVPHAGRDAAGAAPGAIHVFRHDGKSWVEEPAFRPASLTASERLRSAIAADGSIAVTTYWPAKPGAFTPGAAIVMDMAPRFHLMAKPLPIEIKNSAKLLVRHATPGAQALLVLGFTGTTRIPLPWPGVFLGLDQPFLAGVLGVSAKGLATWEVPIPASALGVKLWTQALEVSSDLTRARASNVVFTRIRLPL